MSYSHRTTVQLGYLWLSGFELYKRKSILHVIPIHGDKARKYVHDFLMLRLDHICLDFLSLKRYERCCNIFVAFRPENITINVL